MSDSNAEQQRLLKAMKLSPRARRDQEGVMDRLIRKTKEDPLIPIGFTALVAVLGRGLYAMNAGDRATSYRMMRYRVLFQVGTIFALLTGMYFRDSTDDPSVSKGTAIDKRFYLDTAIEFKRPGNSGISAVLSSSSPNYVEEDNTEIEE